MGKQSVKATLFTFALSALGFAVHAGPAEATTGSGFIGRPVFFADSSCLVPLDAGVAINCGSTKQWEATLIIDLDNGGSRMASIVTNFQAGPACSLGARTETGASHDGLNGWREPTFSGGFQVAE